LKATACESDSDRPRSHVRTDRSVDSEPRKSTLLSIARIHRRSDDANGSSRCAMAARALPQNLDVAVRPCTRLRCPSLISRVPCSTPTTTGNRDSRWKILASVWPRGCNAGGVRDARTLQDRTGGRSLYGVILTARILPRTVPPSGESSRTDSLLLKFSLVTRRHPPTSVDARESRSLRQRSQCS
jgi:hypothetical protein